MTELPASDGKPVAVMFIGNIGAGKSTLLTQLGGNFHSDVKFMEGVTQEVSEQTVILDGKRVILMDTPGLYEIDEEATNANAEKLTRALNKGYEYKLFFVLKGTNRGLTSEDLGIMSSVNKCVRLTNDAKVEFGAIINLIQDDKVYNMYQENFNMDKLRALFQSPALRKYDLDIEFKSVLLVRFDEAAVLNRRLREVISKSVKDLSPVKIKLLGTILARNQDSIVFAVSMIAGVLLAIAASN
ncbi:hypothetical protein BGX34_010051 [Mortierella sp. NVP85]|nr:hypothetical protein BGX34_010051 [Mortierella sp. NVP85]